PHQRSLHEGFETACLPAWAPADRNRPLNPYYATLDDSRSSENAVTRSRDVDPVRVSVSRRRAQPPSLRSTSATSRLPPSRSRTLLYSGSRYSRIRPLPSALLTCWIPS